MSDIVEVFIVKKVNGEEVYQEGLSEKVIDGLSRGLLLGRTKSKSPEVHAAAEQLINLKQRVKAPDQLAYYHLSGRLIDNNGDPRSFSGGFQGTSEADAKKRTTATYEKEGFKVEW